MYSSSVSCLKVQKLLEGYPVLISNNVAGPIFYLGNERTVSVPEFPMSEYDPLEYLKSLLYGYRSVNKDVKVILVNVREEGDEVFIGMLVP